MEPVATIGQARVLLPHEPAASSRIRVLHDGTETLLPPDKVEKLGQIADADCRRMAQDLMPKAIAHTEALYRLFWQDTHPDDKTLNSTPVTGDVDGDGFVTILDVLAVLNSYGLRAGNAAFDSRADLNAERLR